MLHCRLSADKRERRHRLQSCVGHGNSLPSKIPSQKRQVSLMHDSNFSRLRQRQYNLSTISGQGWVTPITIEEVTKSVSSMGQTATEPDRVSRKTMTDIPFKKMVSHAVCRTCTRMAPGWKNNGHIQNGRVSRTKISDPSQSQVCWPGCSTSDWLHDLRTSTT